MDIHNLIMSMIMIMDIHDSIISGLVQDCSYSSVVAMELLQPCSKSLWYPWLKYGYHVWPMGICN